MAFTTSGQETEWALFLQLRRPHGGPFTQKLHFGTWLQLRTSRSNSNIKVTGTRSRSQQQKVQQCVLVWL